MKLTIAPINEKTFEKLISMLSGIKVMHPLLRPYLRKVMTAGYCKGNYKHPHHNQNEVVRTAYYIGTGYIIVYYEKDGDRHVIGICGSNEIVAGSSFMQGLPSRYSIKITRGSYVLMISKQNMERADAQANLKLPANFSGDKVHCWMHYVNGKGNGVSTTVYAGEVCV